MNTKYCHRCMTDKPIDQFPKDKSRPDGHFSYCKQCNYKHSRAYVENNKEKAAEYQREYRQNNIEKAREYGRQHSKQRYQKLKDIWRIYVRVRRSRVRSQDNSLTTQQLRERVEQLGNKCIYCGKSYNSIDHLIPISKGGSNNVLNIVPACNRCNKSKRNSEVIWWFRRQPFYSDQKEHLIAELLNDAKSPI